MLRILPLPLLVLAAVAAPLNASKPAAAITCTFAPPVPFYRAYNLACDDHFLSTSLDEITVEARAGYTREIVNAGNVLTTNQSGSVPLYRLWNAVLNDHFYTPDAQERDSVLSSCGNWGYEGVAAYILPQNSCGTVPLYRMFKGGAYYDHFYTTDAAEMQRAAAQYGYAYESIAGHVWP